MIWGLLAAVGASAGYSVATVLQAVGSRRAAGLAALRQPWVLTGLAIDGAAFALSLIAYGRLPLFVVQTVIASSVAGVVVLAVPALHVSLRPVDWVGVGAVVTALVVLGLAGGEQPPVPPSRALVLAVLVVIGLLAATLVMLYRRGPAWVLGTISALGYSRHWNADRSGWLQPWSR